MPSSMKPPKKVYESAAQAVQWVMNQPDPESKADAALAVIELAQRTISELSEIRIAQMAALHAEGWSYSELGRAFGMAPQRAHQLVSRGRGD